MSRMSKVGIFAAVLVYTLIGPVLAADVSDAPEPQQADTEQSLWTRDTLTNNWFGVGEDLEEKGLSVGLGMTHVYQYNLHDGLEQGIGAYSGSYDIELEADLERLMGLRGGHLFMLAEGSRGAGDGLDPRGVGSLFGVNDDLGGDRGLDVTELWYEQHLCADRLQVRVGKLDLTGGFECRGCPVAFDGNLYANDETSQFLNGSLVNNPAIPFPDNGIGAMLYANPVDWWYVGFGAADAEADARETGLNTTFDGDTHFFYIAETGVVPMLRSAKGRLPGTYRLGVWNARVPQDYLDGSRSERDDVGFYVSADQMLWRENQGDSQGLGAFTRLGWADDRVNEVKFFGSAGLQYRGLIAGRDADVLGLGFAQGRLSDTTGFSSSFERVAEVYYNAEIAPWLHVSPDLQWISNPGGDTDGGDAFVAGLRLQMDF